MTLLNQVVPLTQKQWTNILDTLNHTVTRGDKLLTGAAKENIEKKSNLNEDRKRFYLIASLLDPLTKYLSFCDDKHFPTSCQLEGHGFLAMEFKNFYSEIHDTQVDLLYQDVSVHQPSQTL